MPSQISDSTPLLLGHFDISEADPTIRKLHNSSFDPVDFLNAAIPPLASLNSPQHSSKVLKVAQVQDASAQVQSLLARLNTQNLRYLNTLTLLTDEILRSGSRLAYEVEVLRGDTNGLYEVLTDTLHDDIKQLGVGISETKELTKEDEPAVAYTHGTEPGLAVSTLNGREPGFIQQLRTLSQVKARLDEVIGVFGEAMEWPLAPSELSITSSLISVSAPDAGSETQSQEERAREAFKKLRSNISTLLNSDGGGYAGVQAASMRLDSLSLLTTLWKGTAEANARTKLVDSLAKLIDERRKVLDASQNSNKQGGGSTPHQSGLVPERPTSGQRRADRNTNDSTNQPGGLFRNLQRLRDDFYLD